AFHFTIVAESIPTPVPSYLVEQQPALTGKRLLIMEPNETNRTLLTRYARYWGMTTEATSSAREAWRWFRRGDSFDAIILSAHAPGTEMDGTMLAAEIQRHPDTASLQRIMLSWIGEQAKNKVASETEIAAYLTIPLKPSSLYETLVTLFTEHPHTTRDQNSAKRPNERAKRPHYALRLLLAEDNLVNQKLALHLLDNMGYRADVVSNGLEVLDALQGQLYDIILMDVQMPEMDGLETTRLIRKMWAETTRPRIVAMTANAMMGDREMCLAAGMDDYISKPIRPEELRAILEQWGERKRSESVAPPPPDPQRVVVDRAVLDELRNLNMEGEPDLLMALIDLFQKEASSLMATLRNAVTEANQDQLRRAAHSLKSSSANLGARHMSTLCAELEKIGASGSIAGSDILLQELEEEFMRVGAILEAEKGGEG
nr:response regulator [Ardenticatenales bacterium]